MHINFAVGKNQSISVASKIAMTKTKPKNRLPSLLSPFTSHNSFTYSFNKYIFSASYEPNPFPFPSEAYICVQQDRHKQGNIWHIGLVVTHSKCYSENKA